MSQAAELSPLTQSDDLADVLRERERLIRDLRKVIAQQSNHIEELEGRLSEALANPIPLFRVDLPPRLRAIYAVLKRAYEADPSGYVTRERIIISVWGYEENQEKSVDVFMYYLRDRIAEHETIEAIWGGGYRLVPGADEKRLTEIKYRKAAREARAASEARAPHAKRGRPPRRAKA